MIRKIKKQIALYKYKGHFIRKVVDELGLEHVFVDQTNGIFEDAPALMKECEFPYASIADAKRAIRGEQMIWVIGDVFDYWKERYTERFKK